MTRSGLKRFSRHGPHARSAPSNWWSDDSDHRSHSGLVWLPPAEFAQTINPRLDAIAPPKRLAIASLNDRRRYNARQAQGWSEPPIRDKERLWVIVDVLEEIAVARGVSVAQLNLAWTLSRPGISTLVVGGLNENQFRDNIAASELKLSECELSRLNLISRPPYIYLYWHQHNFAGDRLSPADQALHRSFDDLGMV